MRGTWQTSGSGPGGGLVVAIVVLLIVAGSGAAAAIAEALVTIAIVAAGAVVLAVALALVVVPRLAGRSDRRDAEVYAELPRSDRPTRPIALKAVVQPPPEPRRQLSESHKPALEPGRELHLHFHGLTPDQAAAIVTRSDTYLEGDS